MTSVFKITLKPVLIMAKILGFINMSYTLTSTAGLSFLQPGLAYYGFLEYLRIAVLLIGTYTVHIRGIYYLQHFDLVKFWSVVITARLSEEWTIKYDKDYLKYLI